MKLRNLIMGAALAATALGTSAQDVPKYIFYYIGDGMGLAPVMTAQSYNRDVLRNDQPLLMMQFPVASWAMTYSANAPVTDSAAAGTALSTGSKTKNSMLGMNPDTIAVTSVARQLADMGYGIGVITTVAADDATPGAFYAHVANRSMSYDIDIAAARSGYDFIAGAGLRGLADKDGNPTDVMAVMEENGVQVVRGIEGIRRINSDKVVLLGDEGRPEWNVGYTIDSIPGVLTLPIITRACLSHLESHRGDRFFMMVEGGNIDHALHANDAGAAIKEILNFNEALALAYDFYLAHPDETLILVTADHDTGGMAHVKTRSKLDAPLKVFDWQKVSKEEFSSYCKGLLRDRRVYRWEDMEEYLRENLGLFSHIPVSEEKTAELKDMFDKTFEMRNTADQKTLYASFNSFAVAVFDLINNAAGTAFTTTSHSGNPVPVFAVGVGSEKFSGVHNNNELPAILREICGIQK